MLNSCDVCKLVQLTPLHVKVMRTACSRLLYLSQVFPQKRYFILRNFGPSIYTTMLDENRDINCITTHCVCLHRLFKRKYCCVTWHCWQWTY